MFGFLRKLFKNTSDSEISASGDYNFDQIDEKKSNLYSNEEIYYIHTEPDSADRGHMESTSTIIMNPNMTVYDHVTGREIPMDQVSMEHISPGINIPGIGVVEPKQKRTNNQRASNKGTQNIDVDSSSGTYIPVNADVKYPPTEIIVTSEAYQVYIDLAGVKKTDVRLTFTDSTLTVSGKRSSMINEWKQMSKGKGRKHTVVNSTSTVPPAFLGQFSYKYPFKKSVDESMIEAKFFDGLLHVTLPLRAKSDAIAIAII
jgi:HSP20 family molecular chaperone IbpA